MSAVRAPTGSAVDAVRGFEGQAAIVAAMSLPAFYGSHRVAVERRETHVSHVFLAGDRAYKLKKAVVLPFADLGTLERRRAMCHEEVRLNRRLAPKVYLGVRAVISRDGKLELGPADDPGALEYVVEMRRLDEGRSLAALIDRGRAGEPEVRALARCIAQFHATVPAVEPEAALAMLSHSSEETFATLEAIAPPDLRVDVRAAKRFTAAFRAARAGELRERAATGRFRDGHGDLRLEHVFFDGVNVTVIDCAELAPRLRQVDVGADLSFLAMELHLRGKVAFADLLVDAYRSAGGDPGTGALISFHAAERAWIRAKVALLRAAELPDASAEAGAKAMEAKDLAAVGRRLAWRARQPILLIVCGGAATGKTTLADELARVSDLPVLSSDRVRKRLAGIAPTERGGEELYGRESSAATYTELGRLAAAELEHGAGAIVDATFRRRADRDAFAAALGAAVDPVYLECRAPAAVVAERAFRREADPRRISDATAEIAVHQLDEFEPLDEVPSTRRRILDAALPPVELARTVEELLDRP